MPTCMFPCPKCAHPACQRGYMMVCDGCGWDNETGCGADGFDLAHDAIATDEDCSGDDDDNDDDDVAGWDDDFEFEDDPDDSEDDEHEDDDEWPAADGEDDQESGEDEDDEEDSTDFEAVEEFGYRWVGPV